MNDISPFINYGGSSNEETAYGGEPDCTLRNTVIALIVLYLLYVYVYLPSQQNRVEYGYDSQYDYFTNDFSNFLTNAKAKYITSQ
jgi:hypothetical protein